MLPPQSDRNPPLQWRFVPLLRPFHICGPFWKCHCFDSILRSVCERRKLPKLNLDSNFIWEKKRKKSWNLLTGGGSKQRGWRWVRTQGEMQHSPHSFGRNEPCVNSLGSHSCTQPENKMQDTALHRWGCKKIHAHKVRSNHPASEDEAASLRNQRTKSQRKSVCEKSFIVFKKNTDKSDFLQDCLHDTQWAIWVFNTANNWGKIQKNG